MKIILLLLVLAVNVYPAATPPVFKENGLALGFDATDDRVIFFHSTGMDKVDTGIPWSICWGQKMRPWNDAGTGRSTNIFNTRPAGTDGWLVSNDLGGGHVQMFMRTTAGKVFGVQFNYVIINNYYNYVHFVITYTGGGASLANFILYADGVAIPAEAWVGDTGIGGGTFVNTRDMEIGVWTADAGGSVLNSDLDYIYIIGKQLKLPEVKRIMRKELRGKWLEGGINLVGFCVNFNNVDKYGSPYDESTYKAKLKSVTGTTSTQGSRRLR